MIFQNKFMSALLSRQNVHFTLKREVSTLPLVQLLTQTLSSCIDYRIKMQILPHLDPETPQSRLSGNRRSSGVARIFRPCYTAVIYNGHV